MRNKRTNRLFEWGIASKQLVTRPHTEMIFFVSYSRLDTVSNEIVVSLLLRAAMIEQVCSLVRQSTTMGDMGSIFCLDTSGTRSGKLNFIGNEMRRADAQEETKPNHGPFMILLTIFRTRKRRMPKNHFPRTQRPVLVCPSISFLFRVVKSADFTRTDRHLLVASLTTMTRQLSDTSGHCTPTLIRQWFLTEASSLPTSTPSLFVIDCVSTLKKSSEVPPDFIALEGNGVLSS